MDDDEFLPPIEAVAWARNSGDGHPTLEQIDALTDLAETMLAALQAVLDDLDDDDPRPTFRTVQMVKAAVRQATGG